jgi:hypothetical protein
LDAAAGQGGEQVIEGGVGVALDGLDPAADVGRGGRQGAAEPVGGVVGRPAEGERQRR